MSIVDLDTKWLLLLTGTPIQNNMTELFSIMNLVAPEQFDDVQAFLLRFGNPPHTPSTPDQMLDLQVRLLPALFALFRHLDLGRA
jgi:N12 class adenine-specific DNA methylase